MKITEIRIDGYKNLIGCVLPLGDFTVLAGPNNSGKTNVFEAIFAAMGICFGSDDFRKPFLLGYPSRPAGSWMCHLPSHAGCPFSFGLTMDLAVDGTDWVLDFDIAVDCNPDGQDDIGIISEMMRAKPKSQRGQARTYIGRNDNELVIRTGPRLSKPRAIARNVSSFSAVDVLYPEHAGLPSEFRAFLLAIRAALVASPYALVPELLRQGRGSKLEFAGTHITSFDVFESIDRIWTAKSNYEFFRQTVCDVLDLDDFCFEARDESVTSDASTEEPDTQRFRLCHLKKVASRLAPLEEHSDGTMMAVGLLAKLFEEGPVFPLMCIEEIENCLHPAAIEKLVRFFQDNADEWPVLLTTHSPYVLNMVDPDDLRIMVVDEDGASHIGRPGNRKGINDLLKSSYQSFGDLLVTNFEDVLEKAH